MFQQLMTIFSWKIFGFPLWIAAIGTVCLAWSIASIVMCLIDKHRAEKPKERVFEIPSDIEL